MKHALAATVVSLFALGGGMALAETTSYESGLRCYRDAKSIVAFYEKNIEPTANPQLTFETGIYVKRDGTTETYREVLHRIALYATNYC
jgi:hypothetical protein